MRRRIGLTTATFGFCLTVGVLINEIGMSLGASQPEIATANWLWVIMCSPVVILVMLGREGE